jgi:tRNA(fMet)-specific endonuclease VapC
MYWRLPLPLIANMGAFVHASRKGQPIGTNDLLIAAQSVVLGLILVTDNQREFLRIAELSCENWLR